MADDQQLPAFPDPLVEKIGFRQGGWTAAPEDGAQDDDDDTPRDGPRFRVAVRAAALDWWVSVRSLRFWSVTVLAACAMWLPVLFLVWLPGSGGGPAGPLPWALPAFMVALVLLPAAAALLAVHWGMTSYRERRLQDTSPGALVPVLAATMRGLVFVLLILPGLLAVGAVAGPSGTMPAVSVTVAAAEAVVFGALGVAVASIVRNAVRATALGWLLGLFLVAGNLATVALLVPAVRSEEPVSVAMNVQRAQDGGLLAYDCSPIPAGVKEVYRTERIMWLAASSPSVVFVVLAGGDGEGRELFGWLSSTLQEAADGSQVPCVNGEPRSKDSVRMPMAAVGLLVQSGLAGVLLGSARAVSRRRTSR